jgi:hypothetical protein
MDISQLNDMLDEKIQEIKVDEVSMYRKLITVHTGGKSWEAIVDVVWCQECDQFHIISESVADGY